MTGGALIFNRDHVWQTFGGDTDMIRELIAIAVPDMTHSVGLLVAGARSGDLPAVARFAHAIIGCVGNLAAEPLGSIALSIEQGARAGDATTMPELCEALQTATSELVTALEEWSRELERL